MKTDKQQAAAAAAFAQRWKGKGSERSDSPVNAILFKNFPAVEVIHLKED